MSLFNELKNMFKTNEEILDEAEETIDDVVETQKAVNDDFDFGFENINNSYEKPSYKRNDDHKSGQVFNNKSNQKVNGLNNRIVDINATTKLKVVISKPKAFSDVIAKEIAREIVTNNTVVLNLESPEITVEGARRFLDIFTGIIFATGGNIVKIAVRSYLITPKNVVVSGESIITQLESSGYKVY